MYFEDASRQFKENFNLFGSSPQTQTEKYNLYSGLRNLAEGLKEIGSKLYLIEQRIKNIENKIR